MAGAGSHWRFAIFRPMNDPIGNLARALNKPEVLQTEAPTGGDQLRSDMLLEVTLRRSGLGLVEATRLARLPKGDNLLVVVDQFEELFRFAEAANSATQADDAAAFVKLLLEASRQSEVPLYIVITMRSDFIGDCARFPDLPEAVTAGLYLIPRMTREQRRRAIEEPVGVGGGAISLRLVNRLLNEVGDNPDQLPILQHALMRTWEHWIRRAPNAPSFENNSIDFVDYEAIGGLQGALSHHADEAYDALPDDRGRAIAKRMFQCLTEKGPDNREVRRPTTIRRIAAVAHASIEEVIEVIDEFHRQGRSFLTTPAQVALNGDSVIDISHESLIRLWVRLKGWVEEESESVRTYRRLCDDAERHAQGLVGLLRDPELQNALNWRTDKRPTAEWAERYNPNFDQAMTFLNESLEARAAEEREKERQRLEELTRVRRHLRIVRSLGAVAAVFAMAAGISAYRAHVKAVDAEAASVEAKKQKTAADQNANLARLETQEANKQKAAADKNAAEAKQQRDAAEAMTKVAKTEAQRANTERDRANAEAERANSEATAKVAEAQRANKIADALGEEQKLHAESDKKLGDFLWTDVRRFDDLSEETRSRPDLVSVLERSTQSRIDVTTDILKHDPENPTVLAINVISRDELARMHQKQKSREVFLKTIEDNRVAAEAFIAGAKKDYSREMGAVLLASCAELYGLVDEKDKSIRTAKRATEVADSVAMNSEPVNSDWLYLNFLNYTYSTVGYWERKYNLNDLALDSYKKAVAPQVKSLHVSPSEYAVTQIAKTSAQLAEVQKGFQRFEDALHSYELAIAEFNGYPGLSHKPMNANVSGFLVRLYIERGDILRESTKNFAGAEQDYMKAAAAADAIDRKSRDGQSQGVESDRFVGNALRNLFEDVEEAAAKKRLLDLALHYHQRSLEQDLALLKDDASAARYKDLTYAYYNLGSDKYYMHEYEEARKAYNTRADAAAQAAKLAPSDDALRYLADTYDTIAIFEEDESVQNIPNALQANSSRLEVLKRLLNGKDLRPGTKGPYAKDQENLAHTYGSRTWFDVLMGDHSSALTDSDTALKLDPDQLWILANRGHAFLFLHRFAEAKQAYMKYIEASTRDFDNLKSVTDDFALFRRRHIPKADFKAADAMESLLVTPGGKDLPTAYEGALARIYAIRGNDALDKQKKLGEAEELYAKAGAAADAIDHKEAGSQAQALDADLAAGNGWLKLAEAVEDPNEKKTFAEHALHFHQRTLELELALLHNQPGAERYGQVTDSYFYVGRDHLLMHQYDEALKYYNARADAAVTAAKLYPGDATARLVATCYLTVSNFASSDEIRNIPNALKANQSRIDALKPLVERNNPASQDVVNLAQAYGNQSWFEILLGDFPGALKDSETALKLDPLQVWILGNQAHALLFLRRIEEARQVYLKYKDDASNQRSVLADFAELRKVRPPNADLKLVDDMENFLLTKGGYVKPTEKASNSSNK